MGQSFVPAFRLSYAEIEIGAAPLCKMATPFGEARSFHSFAEVLLVLSLESGAEAMSTQTERFKGAAELGLTSLLYPRVGRSSRLFFCLEMETTSRCDLAVG